MNEICMYCKHWLKDQSHELYRICFANMSGWESSKTEGYCEVLNKWGIEYDYSCKQYEEY